ncbi:hypothetical protein EX895_001891 [Sporisorium graminicola]|uniref:Condensation domain-containing protein n=1 Tax=Sporisorium graminicola TaxID=280036 RepID=A0A4U7KXR4_9BASI|nr:hypothetical protein EX895_001891 [Sporisorium graminicola]TKY89360.1 hypothetical protein EX895_001891 [Sporisorium graminicola]
MAATATTRIPNAPEHFQRASANGWQTISANEAQRPLEGAELAVNYSEYFNQGDFQLTFAFPFRTSLDAAVLERRFPAAIWLTRTLLPELGTSTVATQSSASTSDHVDLDHATFRAITSLDHALDWLDQSAFVIHDAQSFQEVCERTSNERIEPAGQHFRAYLVLDPKSGPSAFVLNVSHVLNGHRLLHQAQNVLQSLLHPSFDQVLPSDSRVGSGDTARHQIELVKAVFQPEDLRHVLPRLPQSLPHAYKSRFQPSAEHFNIGSQKLAERLENDAKPTIGIPGFNQVLTQDRHSDRPMINLRRSFSKEEQERFRIQCKRNKATISSYVYAAVVKAIEQLTTTVEASGNGKTTQGAHLTFPAHASRWLPEETAKQSRSVVTMAIAPASVYLTPEEVSPSDANVQAGSSQNAQVQDTFRLARILGIKQNEYLNSPHILASLDTLGQAGAQGVRSNAQALAAGNAAPSSASSFSTPTLTSQGILDLAKDYPMPSTDMSSSSTSHWLQLTDAVQYGRATSPSVCFSLYSFDGKLHLMVHFDERRFDPAVVTSVLDRVCTLIEPCCHPALL